MGLSHSNSLNINVCSESELLSLKGIGQCIARRILKERAQRPFTSKDDFICRVKGIGPNSWNRLYQQNEVSIVFAVQPAWLVDLPLWLTKKMNQRCRGKLILPQDPNLYRKVQWIVIDPHYDNLYPRTLWGIIESDGINQNGMLMARTGRIQTQQINWRHCVIEQFLNKEVIQLTDGAWNSERKARTGTNRGLYHKRTLHHKVLFLIYVLVLLCIHRCPFRAIRERRSKHGASCPSEPGR